MLTPTRHSPVPSRPGRRARTEERRTVSFSFSHLAVSRASRSRSGFFRELSIRSDDEAAVRFDVGTVDPTFQMDADKRIPYSRTPLRLGTPGCPFDSMFTGKLTNFRAPHHHPSITLLKKKKTTNENIKTNTRERHSRIPVTGAHVPR